MKEITHDEKMLAAQYAGGLDYKAAERDSGEFEADRRDRTIQIGAWRAFEWLEKNGFSVARKPQSEQNNA
jgi:hypothetical protein